MAPIRFGTWIKNRTAQSLPIPGTKQVILVDPTSGLETVTPISNVGGGNPVVQTITFAATIAFNVVLGKWGRLTLTGNVTAFSFSGLVAGDCGILRIFQDATGGRTIAWPGTAEIADGGIALKSGANEMTEIGYIWDGITLSLQKQGFGAVAPDTDPPGIVSVTAIDATTLRYIYDEPTTMTLAGHSWKKNGSAWTASSVAGSGTTWDVTMGSAAINTDVLLRSYNSATGATVDGSANELVSFTDSAVTNSIGGYETESDTFFAANTGLSTPQKDAVDALVVTMKAIGWSKFKAVYPFVGGSAAAHKWNLVNPVDTDGGFRLTFAGSHTHNSNGITTGGTTSDYADTHFIPNTHGTANSGSIGYYVRSLSGDQQLMGAYSGSVNNAWQIATYGGAFYGQVGNNASTPPSVPSPITRMNIISRTGATTNDSYRDGTGFDSDTTTYDGTSTNAIYLFGRNNGSGSDSAGNAPCSFAFIGTGLTSGEVTTLNTAINTFQTALSRNV